MVHLIYFPVWRRVQTSCLSFWWWLMQCNKISPISSMRIHIRTLIKTRQGRNDVLNLSFKPGFSEQWLNLKVVAAAYIYLHCAIKERSKKSRRLLISPIYASGEVYSESHLLADLNFQSVSGMYKNFIRMHASDFELYFDIQAVLPTVGSISRDWFISQMNHGLPDANQELL